MTVDVLAPRIRSADAARLVDGLNEAGFTAASETTSASPESRQDTIVRHAPEDRGAAEQLARYLDGRLSLQETSDIDIGTLALLPGVDLRGVRSEPLSLTEVHQTLSVAAGTGSITSVQPTTKIADPVRTSTTRLGIVPLKAALDWCA